MKTYTATKKSQISNTIVEELNASVLTATFPGKGTFEADLYACKNQPNCLVFKNTCGPINGEKVATVTITI